MWTKVSRRHHQVAKIYSFGPASQEYMLYGWVEYDYKDGRTVTGIPWAARAVFGAAHPPKMKEYEVYLVGLIEAIVM